MADKDPAEASKELACFSLFLFLHDSLTEEEIEAALEKLRSSAAAMPFVSIAIQREDKKLTIAAEFENESRSDELSDAVLAILNEALPEGEETPSYEDPTLGWLTYNEIIRCFEGFGEIEGEQVDVFFEALPDRPTPEQLARCHRFLEQWSSFKPQVLQRLVKEYLDLYNTEWRLDDGAEPITAEKFANRLSLHSLEIDEDLEVEISFDADGMFTEHGLTARLSVDGAITTALQ